MSNIKTLLKYNFLKLVGSFKGKKKKRSTIVAIVLLCLVGAGILAVYTLQAWSMFRGLSPLGLSKICLFHSALIALSVMTIFGLMRSVGEKKQKDENLLLSLPLKKSQIVISKTVSKYLFDFFLAFVLIMPFSVLYMIFEGFNALLLIFSILLTILLPFLSVGISYIANFVILRLFARTKYSNLLKSMCSVFLMILVLAFMFVKTIGYGTISPNNVNTYFSDRPLTNALTNFMLNQDLVSIIVTLAITIIPFVIGLMCYSLTIGKDSVGYSSKAKTLKFTKTKTPFFSMLKKELSAYANNTAFVSNTIMSPVLIMIVSILFASMGLDGISQKLGVTISQDMAGGVLTVIFLAMLSMAVISCSTVSLEGKNLWILKSSPVDVNLVLFSKAMLHVLINLPAIVVSSIIAGIFLKLSFVNFVLLLFVPTMFNFMMAFMGVFINLCLPKLEFENDVQVVKQSLAVLVAILVGLALTIVPVLVYVYLISDIVIVSLIALGLYTLLTIISILLLFTKGKKLFNSLGV